MNDTAAPWRVLEDPEAGGAEAVAATDALNRGRLPALGWQTGALLAAAVLTGIAILLVLTGAHGSVTVAGGGGGPGVAVASVAPAGSTATALGSAGVLVVDVQGAVARPGIVRLPPGSRVADAIASAGGYGPRVAAERVADRLNLAALLRDGDQVVVPSRDDPSSLTSRAPGTASGGTSGGGGGQGAAIVDLNSATASELDALPGIGPVTAQKIIAARQEQPFASVDDLLTRKVVGAATLEKIKELVTVR
jgi:competence protein ComEA